MVPEDSKVMVPLNEAHWKNRMVYNDEDNAPMIDDGRYPYLVRDWDEVQAERQTEK